MLKVMAYPAINGDGVDRDRHFQVVLLHGPLYGLVERLDYGFGNVDVAHVNVYVDAGACSGCVLVSLDGCVREIRREMEHGVRVPALDGRYRVCQIAHHGDIQRVRVEVGYYLVCEGDAADDRKNRSGVLVHHNYADVADLPAEGQAEHRHGEERCECDEGQGSLVVPEVLEHPAGDGQRPAQVQTEPSLENLRNASSRESVSALFMSSAGLSSAMSLPALMNPTRSQCLASSM
jgi:hypothetical protein